MEENILDDFDHRFISTFDKIIDIACVIDKTSKSLGTTKDELLNHLLGLADQLDLNLSNERLMLIFEKLKFHYKIKGQFRLFRDAFFVFVFLARDKIKGQFKPISFNDADEEVNIESEGPWFYYISNEIWSVK